MSNEILQRQFSALVAEAHQVGDSPNRADALAAKLAPVGRLVEQASLPDDVRARLRDALAAAERTLRRDDDGREAARHLQAAQMLIGMPPRKPSPFLDD